MISQMKTIFTRFQNSTVIFTVALRPLHDVDGSIVGYIERVEFCGDRVHLFGWSLLDNLVLLSEAGPKRIRRRLHRGDVATAMGPLRMVETKNRDGRVGFSTELDWHGDAITLCSRSDSKKVHWPIPVPSSRDKTAARRKAMVVFAGLALRNAALITCYFAKGKPKQTLLALRRRFGVDNVINRNVDQLSAKALFPSKLSTNTNTPISIIMPVYNAFELLENSLSRIEQYTDLPWNLILIEDASSDERVLPWLRSWAEMFPDKVSLIKNETNQGFINSVNRGLKQAAELERNVVLLNSDAFVPAGWASRLINPLLEDPSIASVTPMSNDATIFSVPSIARSVKINAGAVDEIDAVARATVAPLAVSAPTGVGFCMGINRQALKHVPYLDVAFGHGYGEEVDWCQKTRALGMRHVGIGNLFVEHFGGASFGVGRKNIATEASRKRITSRYPTYDAEVQRFLKDDPLHTARFTLALAYAATVHHSPIHIYLAHSMKGGAQKCMEERIASRENEGMPTIIIRIGGDNRFKIELHVAGDVHQAVTESEDVLIEVLRHLPRKHVVYSCGVGDPDPIQLPDILIAIASGSDTNLEVLFHDYFPLSPSYNLVDSTLKYRGVPATDTVDPAHIFTRPDGTQVSLAEWRECWTKLIERANTIIVFSDNSKRILMEVWPHVECRIVVHPHTITNTVPRVACRPLKSATEARIGVLGAIGDVKGAQFLSDFAWWLQKEPEAPGLVIIGEFDSRFSLPDRVNVTGSYNLDNLENLIHQYRVGVWLMPSIWPETFSYTTHEMIATGLPVLAFDLGAQGDTVRAAPNGLIVDQTPKAVMTAVRSVLAKETSGRLVKGVARSVPKTTEQPNWVG